VSLYSRYIRALTLRISTNVPDEEQEEEMGIEDGFWGGGEGDRDRPGRPAGHGVYDAGVQILKSTLYTDFYIVNGIGH
jgi:hypothetical protein